jgi:hypothetical protein
VRPGKATDKAAVAWAAEGCVTCGASARSQATQMLQPAADSAGQWRLAQSRHRYSWPQSSSR